MGLDDFMSQNPFELAIPPSEYVKDFVAASINSFITNLEMFDNLILNQLANKKLAPYRLIKNCAETERTLLRQSNSQVYSKNFTHPISGHIPNLNL